MKYIIAICVLFIASVAHAGFIGDYVSTDAKIYNLTVASTTSTALYTDTEVRTVQIDNRSGYTMYLSTYSASAVNTNSMYPILSSEDATKPLVKLGSMGYTHVISSAGVPSATSVYILVEK